MVGTLVRPYVGNPVDAASPAIADAVQTLECLLRDGFHSHRHDVGAAMLHEMRTRCQQLAEELTSQRASIAEGETRKNQLERDLTACRDQLAEVKKKLQQLRPGSATEREPAKPRKTIKKTTS